MSLSLFSNAKRDDEYDYVFKVLLVGESGVGKSSVLLRFCDNAYSESFVATIGVDFKITTLRANNKTIKLQIWDTAGQDRFRSITQSYYRGASAIAIVYDISDYESFRRVLTWKQEVERYAAEGVLTMLIGNKSDLARQHRAVETEEAKTLADNLGMRFLETSAKADTNIAYAFEALANDLMSRTSALANSDVMPGQSKDRNAPPGVRRGQAVLPHNKDRCC